MKRCQGAGYPWKWKEKVLAGLLQVANTGDTQEINQQALTHTHTHTLSLSSLPLIKSWDTHTQNYVTPTPFCRTFQLFLSQPKKTRPGHPANDEGRRGPGPGPQTQGPFQLHHSGSSFQEVKEKRKIKACMRLAKCLRGDILTSLRRAVTHLEESSQNNRGKSEQMRRRWVFCGVKI